MTKTNTMYHCSCCHNDIYQKQVRVQHKSGYTNVYHCTFSYRVLLENAYKPIAPITQSHNIAVCINACKPIAPITQYCCVYQLRIQISIFMSQQTLKHLDESIFQQNSRGIQSATTCYYVMSSSTDIIRNLVDWLG